MKPGTRHWRIRNRPTAHICTAIAVVEWSILIHPLSYRWRQIWDREGRTLWFNALKQNRGRCARKEKYLSQIVFCCSPKRPILLNGASLKFSTDTFWMLGDYRGSIFSNKNYKKSISLTILYSLKILAFLTKLISLPNFNSILIDF